MSGAREKLTRRRPRKATYEGDEFFVRSMTLAEQHHIEELSKNPESRTASVVYSISRCVVNEDGSRVYGDGDDEAVKDIPMDTMLFLAEEIRKATSPGRQEAHIKNSSATP